MTELYQLPSVPSSEAVKVVRCGHIDSVCRGNNVALRRLYAEWVTIHSGHPFLQPESDRDPVRRFRGRLGGAVSLWTSGVGVGPGGPAGLPVSSLLVAAGEPAHVLALLDPDTALTERLLQTGTAAVQLLQWEHRHLADAMAGLAPAPGGAFRLGRWTDSAWGPVLQGVSAWAGVRLAEADRREVGWSVLVDTVVEHVEIGEESAPLVHRRGRYQHLDPC